MDTGAYGLHGSRVTSRVVPVHSFVPDLARTHIQQMAGKLVQAQLRSWKLERARKNHVLVC